MDHHALSDLLKQAAAGLLYPSESDEPFEPVSLAPPGGELTAGKVVQLVGKPAGTPVHEQTVEEFFKDLTTEQDGTVEEKSTIRRFHALRSALTKHLTGLRVFRVGTVRVEIYLVGQTPSGAWEGVKTIAVET